MPKNVILVLLLFISMLLSACNLPLATEEPAITEAPPIPSATPEIVETEAPPTEIVHALIPGLLPGERANHAGDHDSSETASRKHPPGGDRFSRGFFERPFNAVAMDVYMPYIDIIDTEIYEDNTWVYATITLRGLDENQSLPGQYYVEIDQTRDGRGDFLVGVFAPTSSEWTSDNIRIWQDKNDDIGGVIPFAADDNPPYSDGYESLIYDQGLGDIADAAFARINLDNPHIIQIAILKTLFDENMQLLIGMWTGNDLDPGLFDLTDHFTHEQAGAADPGLEIYYPIKEISEMDNSCRMPLGFTATGIEPGLCLSAAPNVPPPPPGCTLTCPPGWWVDENCTCTTLY